MTYSSNALKSFLIYAICIPLAMVLGYLLAQPLDVQAMAFIGCLLAVLVAPLLIRFHYLFMVLAWNMGAVVFFMPGRMGLCTVAILLSFAMAFTHRILNKRVHSIRVPEITPALIGLALVVFCTAELRGGFGFHSMGGEAMGSRRYIEILVAILGFYALTAYPIPREKARFYIAAFFLSGAVTAISVLYGRLPGVFDFIFLFIPPVSLSSGGGGVFSAFRPFAGAAATVVSYLLARHGVRGIMARRHGGLLLLFGVCVILMLLSGSRFTLVFLILIMAAQFWLEGLFRTKLPMFIALAAVLFGTAVIPFVKDLPLPMQRTLAVLPVEVDPMAKETAEGSSEWRRQIWRVTIPQIPQYLLLGKGYAISQEDYNFMTDPAFMRDDAETRAATIAGDYHNGPLSVIMPLGIWGVLAFLWVLAAGLRLLWKNYRYGDEELRVINTFLLSSFIVSVVTFFFFFGSLYSGLVGFTGVLGFSVALNGGVAQAPAPQRFISPAAKRKMEQRNAQMPANSAEPTGQHGAA
jgi:hypothetical protein